ncbi:hypothetical protein COOONC_22230, partial [Cooperia oncophora]
LTCPFIHSDLESSTSSFRAHSPFIRVIIAHSAFEIGVISLESESDLDVARALIQKLLDDHPCLPYEPSKEWRFLDYVTECRVGQRLRRSVTATGTSFNYL